MAHSSPIATSRSATGIPTGRLAMWILLSSEIFIFGGLLVCYILFRLNNPEWATFASHTNTVAGAINTFVLLTSSLFVVLAHSAAEKQNKEKAFKFLWLTIICGFLFLFIKSYEYSSKFSHGYFLTTNTFWSFYFIATALHGIHVIAGMFAMGIISFDVKKGKNFQRVELAGLYWHFVDLVWIFLFPLLYIAK